MLRANKKRLFFVSVFILSSSIATGWVYASSGYHFNITPSFPMGVYQEVPGKTIQRGDFVLFCPPKNKEFSYFVKNYDTSMAGACPSGTMPFIKKAAALEGDQVEINHNMIFVNGVQQKKSTIKAFPYHYQGGIIQKNEVLFLSDYCENSFDGRYFGPLKKEVIISKLRPIYTFEGNSYY